MRLGLLFPWQWQICNEQKTPALSQEMHEVWSGDRGLLHSAGGERRVGRPVEKAGSQPALAVGAPGLRISVDARVPCGQGAGGWVLAVGGSSVTSPWAVSSQASPAGTSLQATPGCDLLRSLFM